MNSTSEFRPPRYRLYIDESGDHAYNLLNLLPYRYLALLGVWFRQVDDYVNFADSLERFKRDIFGPRPDKPVILHRNDIIYKKGPFVRLLDTDIHRKFDVGLLNVIRNANFLTICMLIDKQRHKKQYKYPAHPYHYCLTAMLERYCGWLNYKKVVGDVMAESRGRVEDFQLKQEYREFYNRGTSFCTVASINSALTSKEIKLQRKAANIAGLQLADILAHPVKQAMLIEKGHMDDPGDNFGKQIYEAVEVKFNKNSLTGQIEGYGKKWL